MLSVKSMIKS